jgi:PAS domain S-box-containing protein
MDYIYSIQDSMALRGDIFTEENFKKIIEFAPIGIVIIDRNLKWLLVNQRFCDIVGYDRDELASKTFLDITYKEDVPNNVNLYEKMLEGQYNEYMYEKRYERKDGRIIWAKLTVSAVRIEGEYSHMIALVQDIDESKHYQQDLESKNKELDTLFYKVSHDLKAPVTTLQGLCNLLRIEETSLAKKSTFHHLEMAVQQLRIQNESLLQLTKVYDYQPSPGTLLLEKMIDSILQTFEEPTLIEKKDLDALLKVDHFLLSIALRNILQNAITYCNPERPLKITVRFEARPGQYCIAIRDNGQGISSEFIDQIFNMFYKASSQSKGSGLGLYVARKAVEKMNGTIQVESETGIGSSFLILLPQPSAE